MDGAYTPEGAKAVALKTAKAVAKAAKEQAEKAYEKVVANGGTKEEAELAAKTTQQAVKAAAGEPPAPPPSASISLSSMLWVMIIGFRQLAQEGWLPKPMMAGRDGTTG